MRKLKREIERLEKQMKMARAGVYAVAVLQIGVSLFSTYKIFSKPENDSLIIWIILAVMNAVFSWKNFIAASNMEID
jgi:hypothetical protein